MLTILKIIGICILVILAILLLVLLVLLFVPVRYRSVGKLGGEDRRVAVKVSWLASAISAVVDYRDGKLTWAVKVFGFRILPGGKDGNKNNRQHSTGKEEHAAEDRESLSASEKKHATEKKQKSDNDKTAENEPNKKESEKNVRATDQNAGESSGDELLITPDSSVTTEEESACGNLNPGKATDDAVIYCNHSNEDENKESDVPAENTDTTEKEKLSVFARLFREISHFFRRVRERFQYIRKQLLHIRERLENFRRRLKENRRKAERWKKFYDMEETRVTLGMLKSEAIKLIRYLLPTGIRARVHFGFEDPADTGMVLGAISAIYGFFPKGIRLEPDFEKRVLEGEWKLRGRIRLVYFLRLALRLLLKRENRVTYRRFQKLRKM